MPRYAFLDWVRGLAVVFMIQTHVLNAWTRPEAQVGWAWGYFKISGGAAAPMFCFLAGVSLAFILRSTERAGLPPSAGLVKGLRRAAWLLGVAFLVKLWFFLSAGATAVDKIFRVDILDCMAVSLALATLAGWTTARGRWNLAPIALGLAIAASAPWIAAAWPVAWGKELPWAYLYGDRPMSKFPLVPWGNFTLVGLGAGTLWTSTRDPRVTRRIMIGTAVVGLVATVVGLALWRPSIGWYAHVEPWKTGPAFFVVRLGMLLLVCAGAWAAHLWARPGAWSWLRQLGTTSLLVYWVHLELAYGKLSHRLHHKLDLREAVLGFVLLTAAMVLLSVGKTRLIGWRHRPRARHAATTA